MKLFPFVIYSSKKRGDCSSEKLTRTYLPYDTDMYGVLRLKNQVLHESSHSSFFRVIP